MAQVSLNAIGTALKRVGQVVLEDTVLNRFSRTQAGSGYARVNPFEVHGGTAPSEETRPHNLNDWENYIHSDMGATGGSQLAHSGGCGFVDLTWTNPGGYSVGPGTLRRLVYIKDTGRTTLDETTTSVNPFDTPTYLLDAGDAESFRAEQAFNDGNYYAVGVKTEFDDSVDTYETADSDACSAAAGEDPLTGAGAGIVFKAHGDTPSIDSVSQDPAPADCFSGCSNCLDINIDVTMGPCTGTLEESVNDGAWNVVDSNVPGNSTQLTLSGRDAGKKYEYRLKYNAIGSYSLVKGITTQCDQI